MSEQYTRKTLDELSYMLQVDEESTKEKAEQIAASWIEGTTVVGQKYYYNTVTGSARSTPPDNWISSYFWTNDKIEDYYAYLSQDELTSGFPLCHVRTFPFQKELPNLYNLSTEDHVKPLTLESDDWNSLFIPVVPPETVITYENGEKKKLSDAGVLLDFIENKLQFGKVSRIDFVNKKNDQGITKQMAFVHFAYWFTGSKYIRDYIDNRGEIRFAKYAGNAFRHARYDINRFITFRQNKTPIPEVIDEPEKNMHQLVNNCNLMEKLIEEQKKEIETLKLQLSEKTKENEFLSEKLEEFEKYIFEQSVGN